MDVKIKTGKRLTGYRMLSISNRTEFIWKEKEACKVLKGNDKDIQMALKKYYKAKGPKSQCKWLCPIMVG